eukprot:15467117-Alexandrium_andersonii.AAC.1
MEAAAPCLLALLGAPRRMAAGLSRVMQPLGALNLWTRSRMARPLGRRVAARPLASGVVRGSGDAVVLSPPAGPGAATSRWLLRCRLLTPSMSRFLGAFGAGAAMACT